MRPGHILDPDNTRLTGPHPTSHGLFQTHLASNLMRGSQFRDAPHHGFWTTHVDNRPLSFLARHLLQVKPYRVRDHARHATRAVVCGDRC